MCLGHKRAREAEAVLANVGEVSESHLRRTLPQSASVYEHFGTAH